MVDMKLLTASFFHPAKNRTW